MNMLTIFTDIKLYGALIIGFGLGFYTERLMDQIHYFFTFVL